MTRKLFATALAVALLFWGLGCSQKSADPDLTEDTNLEDDFGGYTSTAEAAGFGDTEIFEDEDDQLLYDDPLLASASVDSLIGIPDMGLFHLRAIWGRLCYDSTVTEVTDWSGSLSVSRGAVILRRIIRFERDQDEILARTDCRVLEWNSFTTVHNDGVAVDLFVPPPVPTYDTTIIVDETDTICTVDTLWPEPVMVKFDTGPYSRTFSLSELAALDTVVFLVDSNAVALHGMQVYRLRCPRGFLAGRWGYDDAGKGILKGIWTDQRGFVTGYLRGRFGVNDANRKVFFGKWIDRSGRFNGFIRGTWAACSNNTGHRYAHPPAAGWFRGEIYNADRVAIGLLKGRYSSSVCYQAGFFQGRWKLHCDIRPDGAGTGSILDDGF